MANTFGTIANVGILKTYFAGPIVSQFNDSVPLYKGAERGKEKYNGQQVNRPIKVARNQGIGATTDGGTLPAIGKQGTVQAVIVAKYNYLRFGLTGPLLKASQGDKGAFASDFEFEMEQGMLDSKSDINRQLFWDGSGKLAALSAASIASPVLTVSGRSTGEPGGKFLNVGEVIDIVDPATGTVKASGVTITIVSSQTTASATITLNQVVTAASADIVVRSGSYNNEIQGLRTFLDGGTSSIYSVDRSTYPVFNGTAVDAASASLRLDLMQQALNAVRYKSGKAPDAIFCDFDSERYYNKLLVADKRYIGERVKGDGTFTNKDKSYLEFSGVPVTPDKDCPVEMNFISAAGWKKYVLCEYEWADESGSLMIPQTSADSFEVRLRLFANMFPEMPSANSRLFGYIAP